MEPISVGVTEVLGLATATGLGLVGLIKSGLLNVKIGKNNNSANESSPMTKGDAFKDVNGVEHREFCKETHEKLDKTVMGWDKINQTMLLEQQEHKGTLKTHREKLEEGSERMNTMQKEINTVDKGVAILLDRSGGDTREKK